MQQSTLSPSPVNTTLVLLCGGQSRRMNGQDKGLLLLGKQAIYLQTLQRLKPQVAQVIISANRNLAEYDKSGYVVIRDTLPDHPGPLAGLLSAMQQIETEWVLTAPCDMPNLPTDLLQRFKETAQQANLPQALVAFDGQQQQHLVCLLNKSVQQSLQTYIASGQRTVHRWLSQLEALRVDFHDMPEAFLNVNTPAELAAIEKSYA